jgi:FkbH-like protein/FkbM family methyltransferase
MNVEEQLENVMAREQASAFPSSRAASSLERSTLFDVSSASYPYLTDHGFQDMVVLPGSFYIGLAARIQVESLHATIGRIKRAEFRNAILLDQNVTLSVEIAWPDDQTVQYTFREADNPGHFSAGKQPCAILEIECDGPHISNREEAAASTEKLEAFKQRATHFERDNFYSRLRNNGNQYGPQFQSLQHVWQQGEEVFGRLCVPANNSVPEKNYLDPIFVDGTVQALAALFLNRGETFILQGIEEVILLQNKLPEEAWVHGRLRSNFNGSQGVGDLDVFDNAGLHCLKLRGVRFAYFSRGEQKKKAPATKIVVASTFTAEPVADSLEFWGDYFGLPAQVSFAPYNQIFQQLLNPLSQMRQNKDGLNVILLNLGDWAAKSQSHLKINPEKALACFKDIERHIFPDSLEIAHLNRYETEYVYQEIFKDQCYLRHGICLPDNATVIDIGANIGLFSLFVRSRCPNASVYSYEPSPIAFRALKANCEAYGPGLHAFNAGVSERRGSAALTFYDKSSVFSSFHPSAEEDKHAIQAVVENMVRSELGNSGEPVAEYVNELMADRLGKQTFECPLVSVSDILHDNHLLHVDLLKVDAEKCELEILRGIDDNTWRAIDQVVIEVHDRSRRLLDEVCALLAKQGFQCAVEEEKLLTGSGLFNVYATRGRNELQNGSVSTQSKPASGLQTTIDEFVQALDSFTRVTSTPTILCLCPPSQGDSNAAAISRELIDGENDLAGKVRAFPGVQLIRPETILARHQTVEFHDAHANQIGHVPYTPEGFAAIGSSVFRLVAGLRRMPHKVIVLDCDNTLWRGICGEEGPLGVAVTPAHRALQEFMAGQMEAGMLLGICSKNNPQDVEAVFARNPNMVLKSSNFAASRINWIAKSENLKSLAAELNLGLDSFIFIDDNPVECAEVRAQCPQVLTLQLPAETDQWAQFLDNVWAFDHLRVTEEDRTRTQKVLENAQREKYRGQVSTLKDFIDGLQLEVKLFVPTPEQIGRVSQLAQRTNQFNFTTIRRSESDILSFLGKGNGYCLAVNVSDRFGDYGMVGLAIYLESHDSYDVDTFLLSCRVLGRGVEHQVLAHLGQLAVKRGKKWVRLHFRPTEKNQPARDFMKAVGSEFMQMAGTETIVRFPAEKLARLRYQPDSMQPNGTAPNGNDSAEARPNSHSSVAIAGLSEKFQRIAVELHDVKKICEAIEAQRAYSNGNGTILAGNELPATLAGKILGIWQKVIGKSHIGMNDNFFEAGGTSLKAVQVVAAIRRELNLHLSIVNIFECPTVRLLSEKLEPSKTVANGPASDAMARGARRRKQPNRMPA